MFRTRVQIIVFLVCSLFVLVLPSRATSVRNLAPSYRHWIEEEVPYIISTDERKEFLSLTTDAQRDNFIAAFWRVRNPDPTSETNSYKEEHYKRLAYANTEFGNYKYQDGWRTAMGRIYITLGPPKQKAVYHEQANLRPLEIWFYESQAAALPPYFYILFFKHSAAEDWRVYSPTMDGPVALVTTGESKNDNQMALKFIRKSAGDEVGKTACTLIPGESVDFDNFSPTMESDMLLATINDLADNPLTKAALEANRTREHVTMSVLTGDVGSLSYEVIRDEQGRETLSYLFREGRADQRLIGERPDGTLHYDLSLRTTLATPDGKAVYEQEDALAGNVTAAQAEVARKKRFGAEARVPLAAGTYVLEATLTNNLNRIASRSRATVTVPAVTADGVGMSSLMAYAAPSPVRDPKGQLPFSFSKMRFTPEGAQTVEIRQGSQLPLVFQLWLGPKSGTTDAADKVHLRYVFGAVTAGHDTPATEEEDVDAGNRDVAGNLLTGHTLDTSALGPGTYRVVVSATRASDRRAAFATLSLKVVPPSSYVETWTAYGAASPEGEGLDDLKRGLSAEAEGANTAAQVFYARAAAESSTDMRPVDRLAALLSRRKDSDGLAKLGQQPILMRSAADAKTLLPIAQALRDHGNTKDAVRLLEAQIKLQPPSTELYRTLADACEAAGDTGRAREVRALAAGMK